MAEYIEREKVLEKLNEIATDYIKDNSIQCNIAAGSVIDIRDNVVLKLPTADVVEVVRCRECKHLIPDKMICTQIRNRIFNTGITTFSNHFCSYGERKEN